MVQGHELNLKDRGKLELTGVLNVNSFDEKEVVLQTTMGNLLLKGEGLHITNFNVAEGTMGLEGSLRSAEYFDDGKGGRDRKGFLERLLR